MDTVIAGGEAARGESQSRMAALEEYREILTRAGLGYDDLWCVIQGKKHVVLTSHIEQRALQEVDVTKHRNLRMEVETLSCLAKQLEIRLDCNMVMGIDQQRDIEEMLFRGEMCTSPHEVLDILADQLCTLRERLDAVLEKAADGVAPFGRDIMDLVPPFGRDIMDLGPSEYSISEEGIAKGDSFTRYVATIACKLTEQNPAVGEADIATYAWETLPGTMRCQLARPKGVGELVQDFFRVSKTAGFRRRQQDILWGLQAAARWQRERREQQGWLRPASESAQEASRAAPTAAREADGTL